MAKEIKLPKPKEKGLTSIEEAPHKRRSVRDYKRGPLSLEQVSQLLFILFQRVRFEVMKKLKSLKIAFLFFPIPLGSI